MSGIVWINWQEYTGVEFFFYGVGCLLWVVAYAIYIRNIIRLKYVEMPVFAAAATSPGSSSGASWRRTTWACCSRRPTTSGSSRRLLHLHLRRAGIRREAIHRAAASETGGLRPHVPRHRHDGWRGHVLIHSQGLDNEVGGRAAYLIQLSISFLYVPLMLRQANLDNFSFTANWTVPWAQRWSWCSSFCTIRRTISCSRLAPRRRSWTAFSSTVRAEAPAARGAGIDRFSHRCSG